MTSHYQDREMAEAASKKYGKSKTEEPHYELPDNQTFKEAGELMIKDETGKEIPFKALYEGKSGQQLIVLIRNFFSTACEDYVRTLSEELPPAFLNASSPRTHLTIIGCGDMGVVPDYRTRTMNSILGVDASFPIYCDPSRKLYTKLGMTSNLSGGEQSPEYVKRGVVEGVVSGVKNAVMSGTNALAGGDPAQNGGEMLVANGELVWFKRMRHTQDHAEVAELKEILGLQ